MRFLPERHEAQAPNLLHEDSDGMYTGGDPGLKSRRVAQKTSFGRRRSSPEASHCCVDRARRGGSEDDLYRAPGGRGASLRDGLAGRTPRSERGGRGSSPCPGTRASSSDGRALVSHTRGRWFDPSLAHHVAVAQPVERPLETREAAGSIPAGHIQAP